eukprot:Opistho-2@79641
MTNRLVVAVAVLVAMVVVADALVINEAEFTSAFAAFKAKYGKKYANAAYEGARYLLFRQKYLNFKNKNATISYNKYSDVGYGEFQKTNMGYQKNVGSLPSGGSVIEWFPPNTAPPSSVDWVTLGRVTNVKDQGQCGSCWTFAASAALEGQVLKYNPSVTYSLSPQNLLDCTSPSYSCNGGNTEVALSYVLSNGGIDTLNSYNYVGYQLTCQYLAACSGAQMSQEPSVVVARTSTPAGLESALTSAIAEIGPIAVTIYASEALQDYSEGVFVDTTCAGQEPNHAVTVVGYGTYKGQDYYLVKNSWGTDWGMGGYVYWARDGTNMCQIASNPVFPQVKNFTINQAACTNAGGDNRKLNGKAGMTSPVAALVAVLAVAAGAFVAAFN